MAHVPLRDLRALPGAAGLENEWVLAVLGEDGYLAGKDAEVAACDAVTVPVVTGRMDLGVVDAMIDCVLAAFTHGRPGSASSSWAARADLSPQAR